MERYRFYRIIATISIALFIVNFAFVIVCKNKNIYNRCIESNGLVEVSNSEGISIKEFEAKANFNELNEDFTKFFSSKYKLVGYELSKTNIKRLNKIKGYYRMAWVLSIASLAGIIVSIIVLQKRRIFNSFIEGGILSILLTAINFILFLRSKSDVLSGIRDMIFHKNYEYFVSDDVLTMMLPESFASWMAISYIICVVVLMLIMFIIRGIIAFAGRPHRF